MRGQGRCGLIQPVARGATGDVGRCNLRGAGRCGPSDQSVSRLKSPGRAANPQGRIRLKPRHQIRHGQRRVWGTGRPCGGGPIPNAARSNLRPGHPSVIRRAAGLWGQDCAQRQHGGQAFRLGRPKALCHLGQIAGAGAKRPAVTVAMFRAFAGSDFPRVCRPATQCQPGVLDAATPFRRCRYPPGLAHCISRISR